MMFISIEIDIDLRKCEFIVPIKDLRFKTGK